MSTGASQSSNDADRASADDAIEITGDMLAPANVEPVNAEPGFAAVAPVQRVRDDRLDFERGISGVPAVTIGVSAMLVGVFVWQLATNALESRESFIASGALWRPGILSGEVWRLLTATALHGGAEHLVGNLLMLYVLGMACEHAFGWLRFAALYLAAALGGSVLSTIMFEGPSVGASGAIFGLAGAVITFLYRRQDLFHLRDKRVGFVLMIWSIYTIGLGFFQPQIDNWCHIGGLLVGAALGAVLPVRAKLLQRARLAVAKPAN